MYILHALPDSAGLVVYCLLREMGVPLRLHLIDRASTERDAPPYRALHPEGKVPVLETPDGPIFETGAILLWLGERHPGFCPAPGSPERAAFLKWFVYTNNAVHTTVMELFYPERHAGSPEALPDFLTTAAGRLSGQLALLEAMAARRPDWCAPGRPTILGYYLSMLLRWILSFEESHPANRSGDDYPALLALARSLETRPAALAAAEAEELGPTIFSAPSY